MHAYEHFWLDPKFWVAVSFVLFFLFLGRKIWGVLSGALDGKAERIRKQLAEAAELRSQAEQMLAAAEAERAAAAREAEELLARARA
ncbi:F0F1 ATP synthase subunit B family protein, partial [Roseomonas rosulenta]